MPEVSRRRKRVRPPRKIVPRGRMGLAWIVGPLVLGAVILAVGILFLLFRAR